MGQVFKSGAFIQQCFAVHPLCLSLKSLHLPGGIIIRCTSCNMLHRLALRAIVLRVSAVRAIDDTAAAGTDRPAAAHLEDCVAAHLGALSVRAMDVVREEAGLRCGECRKMYDLEIVAVETHQR
ncbi:MAG: hypothetical protein A3H49_06615 [Nitrospirae bacterium RIFCSPLOWO2_02_FULL_62_14]|nr:MAG: hypothetical protein A3H49_06615 [Nitrospirae bacterium RIFCSPLOWO2_02_FULL_62_14]OGW68895.1 MAG: hypothetical protein A3A88_10580 [Nitrospirae bacterium RIFCSPLOWO2_01_FULL_62_17]OGX02948.1 MAG: hypothetical protein A3K11_01740 [Nitrospirae bacterium RIFCSPLOWO2_12_FULL_63_8]